jgi:arginase family enzyme
MPPSRTTTILHIDAAPAIRTEKSKPSRHTNALHIKRSSNAKKKKKPKKTKKI